MKRSTVVLVVLLVFVLMSGAFAAGGVIGYFLGVRSGIAMRQMKGRHEEQSATSSRVAAPAFEGTTLEGSSFKLADQKGKVVLLDFWATWCGPCRATMPQMIALHERFGSNPKFVMVGVSLDDDAESPQRYVRENGIRWPQLQEPGHAWDNSVAQAYHVEGIPYTVLIDTDGKIVDENLHGRALLEKVGELISN